MRKFIIGVIQMDSQSDVDENLKTASAFIEEAAARGAKLVAKMCIRDRPYTAS